MGVGTLVLAVNVILLGSYTLGCHSLRHLTGGRFNKLARRPVRRRAYGCVSCLNRKHMLFAWMSLFWVGFSDLYVRMGATILETGSPVARVAAGERAYVNPTS